MATVRLEQDEAILLALAELGRLGKTLKARGQNADRIASVLLNKRVPAHFSFGDGDQRYYAAIAWDRSGFPLDPGIVARTAVLEESSEKARRAWLRLLLLNYGASGALRALTVAIEALQWLRLPSSNRSFDSSKERSRRVALLLKGTRAELDPDLVEVNDGVVSALSDFVTAAFAYVARPDRYQDPAKSVDEFTFLVLHIIRIKFRFLTDPDMYATVVKTRRWLPDGGWQRMTSTGKAVERLRETLIEGLVLLLKQGKVSNELTDLHRQLSSSPQVARRDLARVATQERDLPPEMRTWLETGEYSGEDDDLEMSETDDSAIASALLAVYELPTLDVSEIARAKDQKTVLTPESLDTLSDLAGRVEELTDRIRSLARRRSLSMFGDVGSVVEFSPHAHRHTGHGGDSKVRIIKPGVEATARRGSRVIIRAIVS